MNQINQSKALWRHSTVVWDEELYTDRAGFELRRRYCQPDYNLMRRVAAVVDRVRGLPETPVRWVEPRLRGDTAVFRLHGSSQIAKQLWPEPSQFWTERTGVEVFTSLGRALRQLHSHAAHHELPVNSPHLERLSSYFDNAGGNRGAASSVLAELGADVVSELTRWLRGLPFQDNVSHGGLSLGSAFVDEMPGVQVEVVIGQELVRAPPALDLGWMVGELMELSYLRALRGQEGDPYRRLATAFTTGYRGSRGDSLPEALIHRVAMLRIVLHLCDYGETVGSADELKIYTPFFRGLVLPSVERQEGEK